LTHTVLFTGIRGFFTVNTLYKFLTYIGSRVIIWILQLDEFDISYSGYVEQPYLWLWELQMFKWRHCRNSWKSFYL